MPPAHPTPGAPGAQEWATIAWALTRLGHSPHTAWLHEFYSRAQGRLPGWGPRHLVMGLCAAARWRARPSRTWLSGWLRALRPQLHAANMQVGGQVEVEGGWL